MWCDSSNSWFHELHVRIFSSRLRCAEVGQPASTKRKSCCMFDNVPICYFATSMLKHFATWSRNHKVSHNNSIFSLWQLEDEKSCCLPKQSELAKSAAYEREKSLCGWKRGNFDKQHHQHEMTLQDFLARHYWPSCKCEIVKDWKINSSNFEIPKCFPEAGNSA